VAVGVGSVAARTEEAVMEGAIGGQPSILENSLRNENVKGVERTPYSRCIRGGLAAEPLLGSVV
jgi:hypothetical protein